MKPVLKWIAETMGVNLTEKIDLQERVRHVRSATGICITFAISFSVFNALTPGTEWLGIAELASVLLFFWPALGVLARWQRVDWAEHLLLLGALLISCSLIVLGGVEGTGLFWVYSVPFLVFFIKGQRRGWYYSLAFFACHTACITLINPHFSFAYHYSPKVSTHFLLSLGFYVVVAAVFNHARTRFETRLDSLKTEAEASSQAKSRFLAAASHDLRQPAHALGLFVARLRQLPNDQQPQLVAGVDASVQVLQDMLDNFFDYSRLDSEINLASPHSFELNTVFDKLRIGFAETARLKGLRLRIRPTTAWVYSDPVLLHRILLNLVGNAVHHTHRGSVLLTCRPGNQPGYVRIQVRDSGIGIAPEHQKKVFEEFFQVASQGPEQNKGLGLGLGIVERACKFLNHGIDLRSALGCGSTFTVQVALGQREDAPTATPLQEPMAASDLDGMRILLIDGDALGRAALAGLLQSWGCQVLEAATGEQALEGWNPMREPDCVVTEYRLQGTLDGVSAVRQLRQRAGRDIAACVVSGDGNAAIKQQLASEGLVLLQKPVRPAKLHSLLRHLWNAQQGSSGTAH